MLRLEGTAFTACCVRPPRRRWLAAMALPPLLPLLWGQGQWVRRRTPRLPEASGPNEGLVTGPGQPLRLSVLGESPVAGVGARSHEVGLTGCLARALSRHLERAVQWQALGRSGTTAERAADELVPLLWSSVEALVLVFGVNDTVNLTSPARFRAHLHRLIDLARRRCGEVPVLLAGAPPMDRFPALPEPLRSTLGTRAYLLDQAALALASERVDVHHLPSVVRSPEDFCADRFHPSESGYRAWGEYLGAALALRLEPSAARHAHIETAAKQALGLG